MSYLKKRAENLRTTGSKSGTSDLLQKPYSQTKTQQSNQNTKFSNNFERLQKIIASSGFCSRRKAEELIASGAVTVNGEVVKEAGSKADPKNDVIKINNRINISVKVNRKELCTGVLNKPSGFICTMNDPEGRPTVSRLLTKRYRKHKMLPVGRLDVNTEGVLIFTNDGELMNRLTHPRTGIARVYLVRARGEIPMQGFEEIAKNGIKIDNDVISDIKIFNVRYAGASTWFEIEIYEGKNREVRRIVEYLGSEVSRLKRIAYGPIGRAIPPKGKFRELRADEIEDLYELCGLDAPR